MQLASSSTTPSSLGRPPYPTLVSRGSSSRILTPAITASRVSLPPLISSMALAQQLMPPLNELALDTTTLPGRAWAAAFRARGSAATPNITARNLSISHDPRPGPPAALASAMGHTRVMTSSAASAPYTWDDFIALEEDDLRELIDGELVEVEVPTKLHERSEERRVGKECRSRTSP